jgi:hypothetical protein
VIPVFEFPYRHGHINIGWASWDDGSKTSVSIKYAYPDSRGRISRGSPEIALEDFLAMREFFVENEAGIQAILKPGLKFSSIPAKVEVSQLSKEELIQERDDLRRSRLELLRIITKFPWLDLKKGHDDLGVRYQEVLDRLAEMMKVSQ